MSEHAKQKALYQAYREEAYWKALKLSVNPVSCGFVHLSVEQDTANVQMTEDGAFVEARLWVPKESLPNG